MNKVKLMFIASIGSCLLAGCAKQQQSVSAGPSPDGFDTIKQIYLQDIEKQTAMQAALEVLGQMHFTIEKADDQMGIIRTGPLPAAQFFEFWRSDNVGAYNFAEANLHSIRRIVELDISPRDLPGGKPGSGGQLCIGCDVKVARLSLPTQQITGSSQAYRAFSQSSSTIQKLKLSPQQKAAAAWVDLGEDKKLATEILKRIEDRLKHKR